MNATKSCSVAKMKRNISRWISFFCEDTMYLIIIKRIHDSYSLSNGFISFNLNLWWRQCNRALSHVYTMYLHTQYNECIHFYMLISIGMHRIVPRRITIAIAITIKRRTFRVAKFWIFSYYVLKTYCKCARNTWNELNAIKRCSLLSFFNNFSQQTMCSNIYGMHAWVHEFPMEMHFNVGHWVRNACSTFSHNLNNKLNNTENLVENSNRNTEKRIKN